MLTAADRYAPGPGKRCHVDTLMEVLKWAGNYVRDDVIFNTIQLVSQTPDLQPYVVHETWKAIRDAENCTEKQPLVQVACWCIGEYGASLLDGISIEGETLTVSEDEVIEVYQKILWAKHMSLVTKQYALMSVTKLSTRFPRATPKIQQIIDAFGSHIDTDLQQRGVEFSSLFRRYDNLRSALLEPMPPFEKDPSSSTSASHSTSSMQDLAAHASTNGVAAASDDLLGNFGSPTKVDVGSSLLDIIGSTATSQPQKSDVTKTDNLLDLLECLDFGGSGPTSSSSAAPNILNNSTLNSLYAATSPPLSVAPTSSHNILDGLMSMNSQIPAVTSNSNNLDDLFGDFGGSSTLSSAPAFAPPMTVYDKNEFKIVFDFEKPAVANQVVIKLRASNLSSVGGVSDFVVQAAVPKSMQLELAPPSSTNIAANGGVVTQVLKVNNPSRATLKMRLKLNFSRSGQPHQDQMEVSNFPAAVLQ